LADRESSRQAKKVGVNFNRWGSSFRPEPAEIPKKTAPEEAETQFSDFLTCPHFYLSVSFAIRGSKSEARQGEFGARIKKHPEAAKKQHPGISAEKAF